MICYSFYLIFPFLLLYVFVVVEYCIGLVLQIRVL